MLETSYVKKIFDNLGYVWKIDGRYKVPSEADIADALDRLKKELEPEPHLSENVMGRLLVKKDGVHYDVYVHVGSL